jgi:competence protein ComEA
MKVRYLIVLSALLAAPLAYAAPVNINAADAKTIDKELKGVSPKTAQAIVDYRAKNGPFKSVEDLAKVKGIGKGTIEKNRANLTTK